MQGITCWQLATMLGLHACLCQHMPHRQWLCACWLYPLLDGSECYAEQHAMKLPPDYTGAGNVTISATIEVTAELQPNGRLPSMARCGKASWLMPKHAACAPISNLHYICAIAIVLDSQAAVSVIHQTSSCPCRSAHGHHHRPSTGISAQQSLSCIAAMPLKVMLHG